MGDLQARIMRRRRRISEHKFRQRASSSDDDDFRADRRLFEEEVDRSADADVSTMT